MAKIKLTKNELKKQKDDLKRFNRYLPTLILKKQQLQMEIHKVNILHEQKLEEKKNLTNEIMQWVELFGEGVGIENLIKIDSVTLDEGNIAGIDIPIFKSLEFKEEPYDLFLVPLWVDRAVNDLKKVFEVDIELRILDKQVELLKQELRVTTQRVNLFEKVKIPESKENIRKIQIYMGDEQTAAVVRGKIAKNKIEKAS
ncbi:V-type ATP synthase subunit D [Spirochaetota bacterium]